MSVVMKRWIRRALVLAAVAPCSGHVVGSTMRRTSLLLLLVATGCAADANGPDPTAPAETRPLENTTPESVPFPPPPSPGPGFDIQWSQAGAPTWASKIAACSGGSIYAMATNHALYLNNFYGADGHWLYQDTPSSATSIACDGNHLFALNADKTLWGSPQMGALESSANYPFPGWHYIGYPWGAAMVAGGHGSLLAYNTNDYLYYSTTWLTNQGVGVTGEDPYDPSFVDVYAGGDSYWSYSLYDYNDGTVKVTSVAALVGVYTMPQIVRTYLMKDAYVWYMDGLLPASERMTCWSCTNPLPGFGWGRAPTQAPSPLVEISAATEGIYGLDAHGTLWLGKVVETNCTDGIDNDNNGVADAVDTNCDQPLGESLCEAEAGYGDGWSCLSRESYSASAFSSPYTGSDQSVVTTGYPGLTSEVGVYCQGGHATSLYDNSEEGCLLGPAPGQDNATGY
jgi:hypothetical protein